MPFEVEVDKANTIDQAGELVTVQLATIAMALVEHTGMDIEDIKEFAEE